tara:strand:+ start:797 stop:949 length:153 start_codon:yes stop_codon:yes gene_type:complete
MITKILDIPNIFESLAIQLPTNKFIDKKCSQKTKRKASFEKMAYRSFKPR